MDVTTRELTAEDRVEAHRLEREAFGYDPDPDEEFPPPHSVDVGSFDAAGRLLSRAAGRDQRSWWRGTAVTSCGIADVTVHAEARGSGLLAAPLRAVLAAARERGAVISTMYPTAPGIYRSLGYELIGSYDVVELPTAAAAAVRAPEGVTLRRAGLADVETMRTLYDVWAAEQNGPLDRRAGGSAGTDEGALAAFTAITLALDADGEPIGYAAWDRGKGYDADTAIAVRDLIGIDERAVRALWRMLGTFSSVAPRIRVKTSAAADTARLALPTADWKVVESHPYALRIDDVCGAFSTVPVPTALAPTEVAFAVLGDRLGDTDGGYRFSLVPGKPAACTRGTGRDPERPVYDPRGLALAWAGVQSSAHLRRAGLLTGPTSYDDVLDRLLLGPPVEIRNYF